MTVTRSVTTLRWSWSSSAAQLPPVWIPAEIFGEPVPPVVDGVGTRRKVHLPGDSDHGEIAVGDGCVVSAGTFDLDDGGAFSASITDEAAPKVCPGAPEIANRAVLEAATELRVDAEHRVHVFSDAHEEIGLYLPGKEFHAA